MADWKSDAKPPTFGPGPTPEDIAPAAPPVLDARELRAWLTPAGCDNCHRPLPDHERRACPERDDPGGPCGTWDGDEMHYLQPLLLNREDDRRWRAAFEKRPGAEPAVLDARERVHEQCADEALVSCVTELVGKADQMFEERWVRECFLPTLNAAGFRITAAQVEPPTAGPREQGEHVPSWRRGYDVGYRSALQDAPIEAPVSPPTAVPWREPDGTVRYAEGTSGEYRRGFEAGFELGGMIPPVEPPTAGVERDPDTTRMLAALRAAARHMGPPSDARVLILCDEVERLQAAAGDATKVERERHQSAHCDGCDGGVTVVHTATCTLAKPESWEDD